MRFRLFLFCCLGLVLLGAPVSAQTESILSYHSDITVLRDGGMDVTETITVQAAGQQINHGIYRDFPTRYQNNRGGAVRVGFKLLATERDGSPEPHHTKKLSNGIRVYLGDKDVVLTPGRYTYTIRYHTTRELGFFPDHDELYWNVNGTGWGFSIAAMTCVVRLPEGVPADRITAQAYTGPAGATGRDYDAQVRADGSVEFRITRMLGAGENMTIVASWPKGFVSEPSESQKLGYLISDNIGTLSGLAGLVLAWCWYMVAWFRYGRDPARGAIMPMYLPPENLSPAALRFIERMGFDKKCVASAIINLAVKGRLSIAKSGKHYTLTKTGTDKQPLAPEEQVVFESLLGSRGSVVLKQENHTTFEKAMADAKKSLESSLMKQNFATNSIRVIPGVALSILGGIGMVAGHSHPAWIVVYACLCVFHAVLFYHLLKQPTVQGRKLMDRIDGFKMFLSVTEKDRLNLLNPPEQTPELFERFLPYALALDVENRWSQQFAAMFAAAGEQASRYQPAWYDGPLHSWSSFGSSFGSDFSGSIASASTPPGSSSGGGGSSGGGSGGGGGGGW